MKIFRLFSCNKTGLSALYESKSVACLPDSALLIRKRPFFIPDFTHQCTVQLYAAVKVTRLGRSIHRQFARRYYEPECMTLAACFSARDILNEMQASGCPWDRAIGFDDAVAVAETFPTVQTLQQAQKASIKVGNDIQSVSFHSKGLYEAFDQMLSAISQYYTMRQGDILLYPLSEEETEVHIGDHIRLMIEQEEMTEFNVK